MPRERSVEEYPGSRAAGAVDGLGQMLLVWSAQLEGTQEVHARPFTDDGRLVGLVSEPLVIASGILPAWEPRARVAGLRGGGWAVVWEDMSGVDGHARGVLYRVVAADGALGPPRVANVQFANDQFEASVSAAGDGFVVAWTDDHGMTREELDAGTRARLFDATGAALGGELIVNVERAGSQRLPSVSASATGDGWLVTWTHTPTGTTVQTVRGRRFDASRAMDGDDLVLSEERAYGAVHTGLESGDWMVTWVSRASDGLGDVVARILPAAGPMGPEAATVIAATPAHGESAPSIAPLGGDGYVVAWEDGGTRTGIAFGVSSPLPVAPEASWLAGAIAERAEGDAFVFPSGDGVWLGWSGEGAEGIETEGHRGFFAYHLPRD